MGLKEYQAKRSFNKTPEPSGKATRAGKKQKNLRFVIQKHAASHLHYDFRLELDGVMKSWAIPKGPSLNPQDKRLAMMVEDHPLDYREFEGTIPKGNYGAGTVMVWDEGVYSVNPALSVEENEKKLKAGLKAGKVEFVIMGEKLKGSFALVKMHGKEKEWLLIKHKDEYVSAKDIREQDRSVRSGRTMDGIRLQEEPQKLGKTKQVVRDAQWISNRQVSNNNGEINGISIETLLSEFPELTAKFKKSMPKEVKPMLTTLVEDPFNKKGWLFEFKLDGYRAIAEIAGKQSIKLYSRNLLSFERKFPIIVKELKKIQHNVVLDGEVVALNDDGKPSFSLIQDAVNQQHRLVYYVFDLLYIDGYDIRSLPLLTRKAILKRILPEMPYIQYCSHVEGKGEKFFKTIEKDQLEGMIAKSADSPYLSGTRSASWMKIKTHLRQEAVICGYTAPRKSRKNLGALILGAYDEKGALRYIGHTGTGMTQNTLQDLKGTLSEIESAKCPFTSIPKTNEAPTWVKPKLVCEVKFTEWTTEKSMRHPVFLGLRPDKKAKEVVLEAEAPTKTVLKKAETAEKPTPFTPTASSTKKTNPKKNTSPAPSKKEAPKKRFSKTAPEREAVILTINKQDVSVSHPNKTYWPDMHYNKMDMVTYYQKIAPYILPYLKNRPLVLNRFPNGITCSGFFQKDQPDTLPEWIKTVSVYSESSAKDLQYLVCQNEETLVYLANLGCIEMNPWHSRIPKLDHPDWMVIDLDPEGIGFDKVIETAIVGHKILDSLAIPNFCKTSGKSGLHIYVPMNAKYTYDTVKDFCHVLVSLIHEELPNTTSLERSPKKRQGKIYLDYLQNRYAQTIVAPYSLRPTVSATVSTPLHWSEVNKQLNPEKFTMKTIVSRLEKEGNVWEGLLDSAVNIKSILKQLQ